MKSDVELAIQWSKRFETLLATKFNATGKGLHERIDSVKAHLPDDVQSKLRIIATIRNKLVHDDAYDAIEDRPGFERVCSDISAYLEDATEASNTSEEVAGSGLLLHHFHVQYSAKGVPYVLQPGQVIPVWDLKKWALVDFFEVHCSNAIRWNEFLVAGPDHDDQLEKVVSSAAFSALQGCTNSEERALISRLARIPLGNVGGRRIVRPDPLPVGMVPMEARRVNGQPTLETEYLSVLDWATETAGMDPIDPEHFPPALQFFVEAKDGQVEGYNVRTKKAQRLQAIPLPFTYCSGESLDILYGQGNDWEREVQTLMALTEGFRQMVALNGWKGQVYFGYDLPPDGEGLPDVGTELMTLEYYMDNRADIEVIYQIPFLGDNPFDVLDKEAYDRIGMLLRGPKIRNRRRLT